jgi:glycogen debranching enzyme
MSEALWSGWGIRTLGASEARYNPVSCHNGSVWPHDTALAAGGMVRYGFTAEAAQLRRAIFDLAASQADRRLPELIAGYPRTDAPPYPIRWPAARRPGTPRPLCTC